MKYEEEEEEEGGRWACLTSWWGEKRRPGNEKREGHLPQLGLSDRASCAGIIGWMDPLQTPAFLFFSYTTVAAAGSCKVLIRSQRETPHSQLSPLHSPLSLSFPLTRRSIRFFPHRHQPPPPHVFSLALFVFIFNFHIILYHIYIINNWCPFVFSFSFFLLVTLLFFFFILRSTIKINHILQKSK